MGSKTRLPLGKWLSSRFALDLGRFLTLVKVGLCLDCGDSGGRDLFAPLVNSVFMRVIGYWIRDIVVLYIYHLYIYIYIYIFIHFFPPLAVMVTLTIVFRVETPRIEASSSQW